MTCCGKKAIQKGKAIAKGYTSVVTGKKCKYTDARIRTCRTCEYNTWMTKLQYGKWLLKNGIKVLTNFDDLTRLPMLPKQNTGRTIYCRLCKCDIPKKARILELKCPKDKWKD